MSLCPHIDPQIPLVILSNFAEAHLDFLGRAGDPDERESLLLGEQYHGDRTLLWAGDPKLVVVSYPMAHGDDLCARFGYRETTYTYPQHPTHKLCLDVLREAPLFDRLVAYAGRERTLQLIPYATTSEFLQLVDALRTRAGLCIQLPESPQPQSLWVRDYVDTKAGYHLLTSRWLADRPLSPPSGFICQSRAEAARIVSWFSHNGTPCIVKPDTGENGIGQMVFQPSPAHSAQAVAKQLAGNVFLGTEPITVEEFIISSSTLSPSLEVIVPPAGSGEPQITYLSEQIFKAYGDFCGVLLSRELAQAAWYPALARAGLSIARELQRMGYAGHFDLDAIVDDQGQLHPLEINARRTGGTHVHEFAQFYFGPDYLERVSLLSHEAMVCRSADSYDELCNLIGDLLFPIESQERGVVLTITSTLRYRQFGCIMVGPDSDSVLALQQALAGRIGMEQE